jgi:hypothetical protein
VVLTAAGASCAQLSGIADYAVCDNDCRGSSSGASTTGHDDAQSSEEPQPADDAPAGQEDTTESPVDATDDRSMGETNLIDGSFDAAMPPPADARADVSSPPEAGPDVAPPPVDAGLGPYCGPVGNRTRCSGSQVCCGNLTTQTNSCLAPSSCAPNATLNCSSATECPSSAPICCAQLALVADPNNDLPPKCVATTLTASCVSASSCNDAPPSNGLACKYPTTGNTGMVRLCNHDSDCTTDPATIGGGCYNFNSAPISWCATAAAGSLGVHQP